MNSWALTLYNRNVPKQGCHCGTLGMLIFAQMEGVLQTFCANHDTFGCCSDTSCFTEKESHRRSIAQSSQHHSATDVGMHGVVATAMRASILCYPLVCVHYGPVVDFFITKQTSLQTFDFVRNLFHLLCGRDRNYQN